MTTFEARRSLLTEAENPAATIDFYTDALMLEHEDDKSRKKIRDIVSKHIHKGRELEVDRMMPSVKRVRKGVNGAYILDIALLLSKDRFHERTTSTIGSFFWLSDEFTEERYHKMKTAIKAVPTIYREQFIELVSSILHEFSSGRAPFEVLHGMKEALDYHGWKSLETLEYAINEIKGKYDIQKLFEMFTCIVMSEYVKVILNYFLKSEQSRKTMIWLIQNKVLPKKPKDFIRNGSEKLECCMNILEGVRDIEKCNKIIEAILDLYEDTGMQTFNLVGTLLKGKGNEYDCVKFMAVIPYLKQDLRTEEGLTMIMQLYKYRADLTVPTTFTIRNRLPNEGAPELGLYLDWINDQGQLLHSFMNNLGSVQENYPHITQDEPINFIPLHNAFFKFFQALIENWIQASKNNPNAIENHSTPLADVTSTAVSKLVTLMNNTGNKRNFDACNVPREFLLEWNTYVMPEALGTFPEGSYDFWKDPLGRIVNMDRNLCLAASVAVSYDGEHSFDDAKLLFNLFSKIMLENCHRILFSLFYYVPKESRPIIIKFALPILINEHESEGNLYGGNLIIDRVFKLYKKSFPNEMFEMIIKRCAEFGYRQLNSFYNLVEMIPEEEITDEVVDTIEQIVKTFPKERFDPYVFRDIAKERRKHVIMMLPSYFNKLKVEKISTLIKFIDEKTP